MKGDTKKALKEKLMARGIDIAEDAVMDVVDAVFEFGEEAIRKGSNRYLMIALPLLPQVKVFLKEAVDELDGEDDLKK